MAEKKKTTVRGAQDNVSPKEQAGRKSAPEKKTVAESKPKAVSSSGPKGSIRSVLTAREIDQFKNRLLDLRARLTGQATALTSESLAVPDETPAEDRTDDFDREFALSVAGSVHNALYEIDEALRRIEEGRYGICEISGKPIEKERLKAIPYARYCLTVQAELERTNPNFRAGMRSGQFPIAPGEENELTVPERTEDQE